LCTPPTTPQRDQPESKIVAVTESIALQLESLPSLDPNRKRAKVERTKPE
jgi:hypothetical protein